VTARREPLQLDAFDTLIACGLPIDKMLSVAPLRRTLEEVSGGERRASFPLRIIGRSAMHVTRTNIANP